jgi:hypothetical protein
MRALAAGIPLTLLLDLVEPGGPASRAINAAERPPGDPIWREAAVDAAVARWRAAETA